MSARRSFQFYEHDESRGFVSGGHIACAGVGIPLPINWRLPDAPAWGAAAKQNDRDNFNHSMAVAMVLHDMPRHDNRVELDDEVKDAWGLPVARITTCSPRERSGQGRFLIDRGADILEAAGAKRVQKVYAERVTATAPTSTAPPAWATTRRCRCSTDGAAPRSRQPLCRRRLAVPDRTGANPTLTIMANAWRVAENVIKERGR